MAESMFTPRRSLIDEIRGIDLNGNNISNSSNVASRSGLLDNSSIFSNNASGTAQGGSGGFSDFFASPEFANSLKALEALGSLGTTFLGYQGLGLAKDQFKFNKKMDIFNANAQVSSYNTEAERRAKISNQFSPGSVTKEELERIKLKPLS